MKKIIGILAVIALLVSCGKGDRGQLTGKKGKKWHPVQPKGMVKIPDGSFVMGKSDYDLAGMENAPTKTVSVSAFYMDETAITNAEYRQFVHWVRDSVIRQKLAEEAEFEEGGNEQEEGYGSIQDFAFKGSSGGGEDEDNLTPYQKYSMNYEPTQQRIDWDKKIIWKKNQYPDEAYVRVMDEMYIPGEESLTGNRMLDVKKFVYKYNSMDLEAAARKGEHRGDYIQNHEVKVYPDTTAWIKDFNYSYNEPMHNNYFWHTAYDDYPVVGVSWNQAKAFADWRTAYHNSYRKQQGIEPVPDYRLPSEAEWEYAARGGLDGASYPWGGPYTKNDRGCFLANFKPLRGDYAADEALYTVEAKSFEPNGYGLYNMAGNVSEWVHSDYDPSSYEFFSSINPVAENQDNKRKVVRGGSWKDVAYYLQVSSRDYEYADSSRSYIGFRTVQNYTGNSDKISLNRSPQ